jgi:hypothetical protein
MLRLLSADHTRVLAVVIALTSAIVATCAICWAHSYVDERGVVSWYPIECCHDGDCRPLRG